MVYVRIPLIFSQHLSKLVSGHASLNQYRTQQAGADGLAGMQRNGDSPTPVGVLQLGVRALLNDHDPAQPSESSHEFSTCDAGEGRHVGTVAATREREASSDDRPDASALSWDAATHRTPNLPYTFFDGTVRHSVDRGHAATQKRVSVGDGIQAGLELADEVASG